MLFTKPLLGKHRTFKSIGDFTYGLPRVIHPEDGVRINIGKYCSIAEKVTFISGGKHEHGWITTYPFPWVANELPGWPEVDELPKYKRYKGDINVGNDVWIGYGATILSGVSIGDGAVIGAHTVVSQDIPAYSIVVGNPGVVIKKRFSDRQIAQLLEIRWWDWSAKEISKALPYLCSDSIDRFVDFCNSADSIETSQEKTEQCESTTLGLSFTKARAKLLDLHGVLTYFLNWLLGT